MRLFSYLAIVMVTLVQLPAAAQVIHPCNATGTCGNVSAPSMSGNFVVPLANQERETPVVNNNSYVTQQVTQQVTQTAAPIFIEIASVLINNVVAGHPEGSAPWMINGGHRACQHYYGLASGQVVEYYGGSSVLACYRY